METDKKTNVSALQTLIVIAMILFGLTSAFCGYKYISAQRQYSESIATYEEMTSEYVTQKADRNTSSEPRIGTNTDLDAQSKASAGSPIEVDFAELSAQASRGTVPAWIYCEGTVINYPVAYCDDNDYYLARQLNGNYNACGTLFIDCRCRGDFSDGNTIIYGHRMADGQMFNSLEKYRNEDGYYDEHPVMYINTPAGDYELQVYSTFISDTQSKAFTVGFANDDDFQEFIDFTLNESLLKTDVEVTTEDRVVTLVTCSYECNNARTIVCGKLVPIG